LSGSPSAMESANHLRRAAFGRRLSALHSLHSLDFGVTLRYAPLLQDSGKFAQRLAVFNPRSLARHSLLYDQGGQHL
jgi:hypothetical protein